jgi:DNA-binding MarR family transcriptional regulator
MYGAESMVQFNRAQDESVATSTPSNNLIALTSRAEEIAAELRMLTPAKGPLAPSDTYLAVEARKICRFRRKIDEIFQHDGFSRSPAWDIMLDLFEANAKSRSISVSSACIAAACPDTTALRWIHALEELGLITRSCDPFDKRRTMISLTQDGLQKTTTALRARLEI